MEAEIGLTKAAAGLIASANFLGYLLGALGASWRALPGESHTWFVAALGLSALTTGLMGVAADCIRTHRCRSNPTPRCA